MISSAISQFGAKIGLKGLALNDQHSVHIAVEELGDLYLEESGNDLLIYVSKKYPNLSQASLESALAFCHFKERSPFKTSAGLHKDETLAFIAREPQETISEAKIMNAIEYLNSLHEKIVRLQQ